MHDFIWIFGYIILCWLMADFIAGFFHWWEDQYATEDMWIIGTLVAGPNSMHHDRPTAFLAGNYWGRNWTTIVPALAIALPLLYWAPFYSLPFFFATQANEIHGWSHQKCSPFIRILQEIELFTSVKHHAQHHVDPFSRRYCVMSGWLNPVLDYIGIWAGLEWIGRRVFEAEPKHSYFRKVPN